MDPDQRANTSCRNYSPPWNFTNFFMYLGSNLFTFMTFPVLSTIETNQIELASVTEYMQPVVTCPKYEPIYEVRTYLQRLILLFSSSYWWEIQQWWNEHEVWHLSNNEPQSSETHSSHNHDSLGKKSLQQSLNNRPWLTHCDLPHFSNNTNKLVSS